MWKTPCIGIPIVYSVGIPDKVNKYMPDDITTQLRTGEEVLPDLDELEEKANDDANVFYE